MCLGPLHEHGDTRIMAKPEKSWLSQRPVTALEAGSRRAEDPVTFF